MNNFRCGADEPNNYTTCLHNCKYHEKNKRKIHFVESDNTYVYKTVKKWNRHILDNWKKSEYHMSILGVDYCNLNKDYFKSSNNNANTDSNIYCRFFRTAVLYSLKRFCGNYEKIIVDNIYHDIGDMKYHKYFKKQVINYVKRNERKIVINCDQITFLQTKSENCLEENNIFLQLIDIFLGESVNLIHAKSKQERKKELSLELYPIVYRCINKSGNINSRYYHLYSISFFPKYTINDDMDELERKLKENDNFYNIREIRLSNTGQQLSLFD